MKVENGIQMAMRALECNVKKAEVLSLMQKYSKDEDNEIGSYEFMQISELPTNLVRICIIGYFRSMQSGNLNRDRAH